MGFKKLEVADCEANPKILEEYFETWKDCPEYVVQEFIEGFCRNWEVRCFWFNGEFLYAMANRAAVSTSEGEKVGIITGDDIPQDFLEEAKKIGQEALKALPQAAQTRQLMTRIMHTGTPTAGHISSMRSSR